MIYDLSGDPLYRENYINFTTYSKQYIFIINANDYD